MIGRGVGMIWAFNKKLRIIAVRVESSGFDFGRAINLLKDGRKVARAGWNGKGMWLVLLFPGGNKPEESPEDATLNGNTHIGGEERQVDPCVAMKTAQNTLQPGWLASQADMLAEDWELVE